VGVVIRRTAALAASAFVLAALGAAPVAATPLAPAPGGAGAPGILGINALPVPLPDVYTVVHDRKLRVDRPGVLANDIDADGDKLEAKLTKGPDHGKVDLNHDGGFDYEPDHGFTGIDTFTYQAHDGTIGVAALVTITVTNVAPLGRNDHYATKEGVKLQVDRPGVLKNDDDADGDRLKAKLVGGPDHGKLDLHDGGEFDYEPVKGFSGTDVFTYRAVDGADQSAVIRVVIDVEPKPTPTPTMAPTPTPSPAATPRPTPKPDKTDDPQPDRTREPRPTDSPNAGGGSGGNDGGSGIGPGSGKDGSWPGGPAPSAAPVTGSIGRPVVAAGDQIGLARAASDTTTGSTAAFDAGMVAAFDGFAWQVPALALSVPGLIVVVAVFLQVVGGLAWLPVIRRRLGGDGLTGPDRRP
jgi:hypothetical protein